MRKTILLLCCLVSMLLIAALPAASLCEADPNVTQVNNTMDLDTLFGGPHLVYNTIPEDLRDEFYSPWSTHISLYPVYGRGAFPYATELDITYISGNEDLLKTISFNGEDLSVDFPSITEPGEVTFHIHAEARGHSDELYVHDKDYTLRTIPYSGPIMEFRDDVNELTMRQEVVPFETFFDRIAVRTPAGEGIPVMQIAFNGSASSNGFSTAFAEEGDQEASVCIEFSGISYRKVFTFHINPYVILGPDHVYPGYSSNYSVAYINMWNQEEPAEGFSLTAEGNGVTVDENGSLTVDRAAAVGESVRLKATRNRDGMTAELNITVSDLPWNGMQYKTLGMSSFSVPVPDDDRFILKTGQDDNGTLYINSSIPDSIEYNWSFFALDPRTLLTKRQMIKAELEQWLKRSPDNSDKLLFNINGIPAAMIIRYSYENSEQMEQEDGTVHTVNSGALYASRATVRIRQEESILSFTLSWSSDNQSVSIPPIDQETVMNILGKMNYQGAPVEITEKDPVPEIIQPDNITTVHEGDSLDFTVSEASMALANSLGEIKWSIVDSRGNPVKEYSISKNGTLKTVKGKISRWPYMLNVCAQYENSGDVAMYQVQVIPLLKKLWLTSSCRNGYAYVGAEHHISVNTDPRGAEPGAIEFSIDKEDLIDYVMDENGMGFTFTPKQTGKIVIRVKNDSGKKAEEKVILSDNPVTGVKISLKKGQPKPGGTLQFSLTFEPKKPDDPRNNYWSLDVDESIATINSGTGEVKIKKDAPSGTVFTVTCTAYGTPEPDGFSDSMEFTVE